MRTMKTKLKTVDEIGDLHLHYLIKRDSDGKIVYQEAFLSIPTQQERENFEAEYLQLYPEII